MNRTVRDIDDYLDGLPDDQRKALEKLRKQIRAAAPDAEECISYQLPAFRQGRMLCCFGAAKAHCALYPMSARLIALHAVELADFDTSSGTIRFTPKRPLPAALVRKLVKERLAEDAARGPLKRAPKGKSPARKVPKRRATR